MRELTIEISCGTGSAKKQITYFLTSANDDSATPTTGFASPPTFAGSIASNCDETTTIVDNMQGNFASAGGTAFTLTANGLTNTYVVGSSSIAGSLVSSIPVNASGSVTATFDFNKAADTAAAGNITAHSTATGTTTVTVTDGCAGTATITTIDPASFIVWVPQALTNPVQSTVKVHDLTGATTPYVQDGPTFADPNLGVVNGAEWTFDFSTATNTDAALAYTLTVTGTGSQNCTANLTANVTASGGTAVVFPPASNPPPNPLNLTPNVISSTRINLAWTSGGGTTAQYRVAYVTAGPSTAPADCTTNAGANTVLTPTTAGTDTFSHVGDTAAGGAALTTGTTYAFRVCSRTAGGILSGGIVTVATTP